MYKKPDTSADTHRSTMEFRNFRQYYNRTPNLTPSSTVLNSPSEIEDGKIIEQYQNMSGDEFRRNLDPNLYSTNDFLSSDDDVSFKINSCYENRLVTGCSPTSSQSSNSAENASRHKGLGSLQITNLHESPRRPGNTQSQAPFVESSREKSSEIQKSSPGVFPKRAPGFPKRIVTTISPNDEPSDTTKDLFSFDDDLSDPRQYSDEFLSPQLQQQFQQQKLLEFQQQSKRQQVEKALPLDELGDFDSQQSSASYSQLQRLVALKQIQQKQHYEHQLQQQYENRRKFEETCAKVSVEPVVEQYDEELDKPSYYTTIQSKNFTMSPETTDYDSNCGDMDSEFSLKYIGSERSFSSDFNGTNESGRHHMPMPILEDGLSDTENNNSEENDFKKFASEISGIQATLNDFKIDGDKKGSDELESTLFNIRGTLERSKKLSSSINEALVHSGGKVKDGAMFKSKESLTSTNVDEVPVKVEDEEADTDLETDRLLGRQRMNELQKGGFDDNRNMKKVRCANGQIIKSPVSVAKTQTAIRNGVGTLSFNSPEKSQESGNENEIIEDYLVKSPMTITESPSGSIASKDNLAKKNKEVFILEPQVLIEGVLFRARYLGSTQLVCEGQPTKSTRMMQAEEAVSRIKAPDGESQPNTEVDLFISTEKIMVLNTDLKEVMMDHALKTISYIADIGYLVVLMARRRFPAQDSNSNDVQTPGSEGGKVNRMSKMICHVFESEEAQFIAQSIGQAFQVAYMEFLKANGIEDHSFMKEMDYQEVLNSQEIFGDELEIFAKKERQKEVVVPKAKGEILGVVIVESGWGSMLPTVVIANLCSTGAAFRCGQLNIGDQIIAINGLSLVGLPLSQCQTYIKNTKNQTAVKFTVVPCAPVVEVKIKRPNTKYQLGFSVQNGVICSLLRGGIAERGGVRVGHRIIEINNQSVVAVPHDKIVSLLATSVGEILMKTMPTSMFRLLTGQENPMFI